VLLTTDGAVTRGLAQRIVNLLPHHETNIVAGVKSNPTIRDIHLLIQQVKAHTPTAIIALGGGSVIDAAKVIAACLAAPDSWTLESALCNGQAWHGNKIIPIIAIPTTAGTGAEVTAFATVWDDLNHKKLSLAHPALFPHVALIDPNLLVGSPREVILSCGLDALSQGLEAYWNRNATPVTDEMAIRAIRLALRALPAVLQEQPSDQDFADMAQASHLAGLCISHTRTALAHAMSYPMTAHFGVPHGLACGITLPALLRFNADGFGAVKMQALVAELGIQTVSDFVIQLENLLATIEAKKQIHAYINNASLILPFASEMVYPGRSDNNIRSASVSDIEKILHQSLSLVTS
jgi:alcohol dehydrogenase